MCCNQGGPQSFALIATSATVHHLPNAVSRKPNVFARDRQRSSQTHHGGLSKRVLWDCRRDHGLSAQENQGWGFQEHFAFLGFRREEEAQKAVKVLNRSFFDTSRMP
mmetsp:Transcript_21800/g.32316  ORF Transcript_21800/g.32316 Transcript_21800/m.32316 type:complete len:107 (+) Transcript_21800:48-368(+)